MPGKDRWREESKARFCVVEADEYGGGSWGVGSEIRRLYNVPAEGGGIGVSVHTGGHWIKGFL
jgi:hypothetical protein